MNTVIERLYYYVDNKGDSIYKLSKEIDVSNGYFSKQRASNGAISSTIIEKIVNYYIEINPDWLLTGRGSMVRQPAVSGSECAEKMAIVKEKMQEREEVISLQRHRIKSLEQEVQQLTAENQKLKKESLSASHSKPMAPK